MASAQAAPAVQANLHHAVVLADRLYHLAAFPQGVGTGLLDVHVLAGLAPPDRRQRMPVIRCGNRYRAQIILS